MGREDRPQLAPTGSDAGASLFGRRRARLGSAALAMRLAWGLTLFVFGRGPGSLVWLNGAAPQWLPFAGSGVTWLPLANPTAEPLLAPSSQSSSRPATPTATQTPARMGGGSSPLP